MIPLLQDIRFAVRQRVRAPGFSLSVLALGIGANAAMFPVLSDDVWRSQFHADLKVRGETVRIDDRPVTVIGVMPRGFLFPASGVHAIAAYYGQDRCMDSCTERRCS